MSHCCSLTRSHVYRYRSEKEWVCLKDSEKREKERKKEERYIAGKKVLCMIMQQNTKVTKRKLKMSLLHQTSEWHSSHTPYTCVNFEFAFWLKSSQTLSSASGDVGFPEYVFFRSLKNHQIKMACMLPHQLYSSFLSPKRQINLTLLFHHHHHHHYSSLLKEEHFRNLRERDYIPLKARYIRSCSTQKMRKDNFWPKSCRPDFWHCFCDTQTLI